MKFGLYIKCMRIARHKTLHEVAISTNIDATLLSKIERGSRCATDAQLYKLARFFNTPLDNLKSKAIAEKIIKNYGLNETTINALYLVQEEFKNKTK